MAKETYIVNGKILHSMDDVNKYCSENNYRITNTETIRKNVCLITVVSNKT
jgi:hypothetical protein